MKLLNTAQAAEALGVSARRIRAMIDAGTLPAHRIGREYAIEATSLPSVRTYGRAGRPSKDQIEKASHNSKQRADSKKPQRT